MSFPITTREELEKFIIDNVINTTEAIAILGCSRQNLFSLVERGKIKPIRELPKDKWFFKSDILVRVKPSV